MKTLIKSIFIVIFALSGTAFASELSDAKGAGLIGEQHNGYLGVVKGADPKVAQLVKATNAKRKAKYKQIAAKRQIPLSQVEQLAGKKTMAKTAAGNFIKPKGKGWTKK